MTESSSARPYCKDRASPVNELPISWVRHPRGAGVPAGDGGRIRGRRYRWPAGSGESVRRPGSRGREDGAAGHRRPRARAARYPRDPWPASDSRTSVGRVRRGALGLGLPDDRGMPIVGTSGAGPKRSARRGCGRWRPGEPGRAARAAPSRGGLRPRPASRPWATSGPGRRAPARRRGAPRGIPSTVRTSRPGRAPYSSGNRCRPLAAGTHRTSRWSSRWAGTAGVSSRSSNDGSTAER